MHRFVVAVALLASCSGDRDRPPSASGSAQPAPSTPPPAAVNVDLPKLPSSPEGRAELHSLDQEIALLRTDKVNRVTLVHLLLGRAAITGTVEDYVDALAVTDAWVRETPKDPAAWKSRVNALSRVHRFAAARQAIEKLKPLVSSPSEWQDLEATIEEATGHPEKAAPFREQLAKVLVRPETLTQLAGNLALRGKIADAVDLIPKAAAVVRDNSPVLFSWLFFQWGRLWEQKGEVARAREAYAEAHRRLPGYLEATVHLAQLVQVSGEDASKLVAEELEKNPHPELLALAGKVDDAKREWERYVAALPEAFSDHAARFYLTAGKDPLRALALAQANLANRDTPEARSLAVEAALAANAPGEACSLVDPLFTAPLRAQQFMAWRAVSACGRKADADKLAAALGIH